MPRTAAQTQAFLKTARERYEQSRQATDKQRQRVLDDLRFYAGGEGQWDPEMLRARQAQQATADGLPPVPARPCITINKVREPVHQVLNQERQSEMGIQLVPADDWGDLASPVSEEEIELREGLVRRIQRESEAADARTWAFARAAIAGEGFYRILTRYAPGKTWDKDVFVSRIYNQASVMLDPAHEQPDASDCEWEFIGGDLPWDRYKREYPKAASGATNEVAAADDATFRALGEEYPGWFSEHNDTKSARVVEYFYTEWTLRTLVHTVEGQALWEDELPEGFPAQSVVDSRAVADKQIMWAKIDAKQILDETEWEGPDMPIVKVVGEELQPYDNEKRAEGMVRPARGAQEGYNAMVSKWVETVGLAPIPPFQVAEENIGPYGRFYQLANTRTLPMLPFIAYDASGRALPKPDRTPVDTPIQAIAASVQLFDEAIKSTTMVPSVQLGQATDPGLKTKGGINSLIDQGQLGTSHLMDNLRRSIRYEGQVINNLLFAIYGRPGRLARLLNGENEPMSVRISAPTRPTPRQAPPGAPIGAQPYAQPGQAPAVPPAASGPPGMVSPSSGAPPMAGAGAPPIGASTPPPPLPSPAPKTYTLTKNANFNVLVKVTRSFDSRRLEEATTIGSLLEQQPQLMAVFGDLYFKNQDGPGHEEMAERAEIMLDPKIQAYRASKAQGMPVPPQVQAQMAQMKGQLDQAHQLMAKAESELRDRGAQHQREQATKVQITQMELASKEKIAALDRETKITVAELSAKVDRLALFLEERERVGAQLHDSAHEAGMAAMAHAHATERAQLGHAQALEQGQQPPPVDPHRPPPPGGATP